MNLSNTLFYLTAQAEGQAPQGGGLGSFMPLILIFVIFYFLLIRPQKQKKLQLQVDAMRTGDKVITAGGIHGLVTNVKNQSVTVKVDNNVKIEFEKGSIATVINKDSSEPEPEPEESNNESDDSKTEEGNRDTFQRDK